MIPKSLKEKIGGSGNFHKPSANGGLLKIKSVFLFSGLLCCAAIFVYWPLKNNDFINLDDNLYVTENAMVKRGLTIDGIQWAFRFNDKGYWQPLTWVAHMVDCELFGLSPAGHHFANLIIHLVNTLLLFWILHRTTKCLYRSAFVAALFALHPLNVESVAWLAERKNLLSTFFWLLTILLYTRYVRRQNFRNYLGVLVVFMLGLMTKPMAVTLPFLMLLLDLWPLGRIQLKIWKPAAGKLDDQSVVSGLHEVNWPGILLEKIPLFMVAVLSILISVLSLQHMQIMISGSAVPLKLRLANALVSYISYLNKLFWPHDLAIFYPFPRLFLPWQILGALACLTGICLLSIVTIRRRPYFFAGWFWYLGTLLPVIGLVQTGIWPALADRWAYFPAIGLFIILVWGTADLSRRFPVFKSGLVAVGVIVLLAFAIQTRIQLRFWEDSVTLFQHTLQATGDNEIAYHSLGDELVKEGKLAAGIDYYRSALRLKPGFARVHNNLGAALARSGDTDKALAHFQIALKIKPQYAEAHNNLGVALRGQGQLGSAAGHFMEALRLDPSYAEAYNNLGILLMQQGKIKDAVSYFRKALAQNPDLVSAQENLLKADADLAQFNQDVAELQNEQRRQPQNPRI